MKNVHSLRARFVALPLWILAECARYAKVSFIVGSKAAFFSAGHCVTPLLGLYHGIGTTLAALSVRACCTGFALGLAPALALAYHIPTVCAALYLATIAQERVAVWHRASMALLIALCFLAFCLHPIGSQALLYTIFWVIPFCSTLFAHRNTFVHALASTFTAHAVGSVIWLYSIGPVTPAAWLALLPVVVVERLLFASGMTFCIAAIALLKKVTLPFGKKTVSVS